jgi:Sec-independent protein translocase protein TatA
MAMMGFLPGSVGGLELVVLFAIVLILFGPKGLPQAARQLGRMLEHARRAADQFRDQVMRLDGDDDVGEEERDA